VANILTALERVEEVRHQRAAANVIEGHLHIPFRFSDRRSDQMF
jgi:hypothetical protein